MPIHDWTRVEPNFFHDFHVGWIAAIRHALNNGGLPPGFYALAEQTSPPIGPDVITLKRPAEIPARPGGKRKGSALAVAAAPPKVRFTVTEPWPASRRPQRRIGIRHNSNHDLVAVIEIVSPGTKSGARAFRDFVNKAVAILQQRLQLLVIDLFPPTARDPNGIHAAIWKALVRKPFARPADRPLTLVSYAAGEQTTAYVEPVRVGERLPPMPLFLTPERYVNVPLEATYQTAWDGFPDEWQAVLEADPT